jgi:hypothetical protein
MSTTPSLRFLSSTMPTPFLIDVVHVYQSLKPVSFTSVAIFSFHFVSWTQRIFTCRLIILSTTSRSLLISDSTFQVPTHTLLSSVSFFILRIHRVKCEDPCSFFTTPERRCSVSVRMRWPNSCSFNIVSRSRYGVPPRRWQPDPCPFNTIPGFRYDALLKELCPIDFSCAFIYIEMAKLLLFRLGTDYVREHMWSSVKQISCLFIFDCQW